MLAHTCFYIMLITVTYMNKVNALPVSSTDAEIQNNKLYDAPMFERFGIGSNQYLVRHPYSDDNIEEDEILHDKRQLKKKWAKFYQGAQSPYTIAFPALIRTRRWIE